MKILLFLVLIYSLTIITAEGIFSQTIRNDIDKSDKELIHEKVVQAINKQMDRFVEDIPVNLLHNYGIYSKDEINQIVVGEPFEVYTLIDSDIFFANTWRVPVVIEDEYRALFTVISNAKDEYRVVDFGATILAEDLSFYRQTSMKGILRVYEIRTDFVILPSEDKSLYFIPLQKYVSGKHKYDLADILNMILKD